MTQICMLSGMDNVMKCAVVAGVVTVMVFTAATAECLITTIFLDVMRTTLINFSAGRVNQPYTFNPDLNHNRALLSVGLIRASMLSILVGMVCGIASSYFFPDKEG